MNKKNKESIMVTVKEKPIGIIRLKDLLQFFLKLKKEKRRAIQIINLPAIDSIDREKINSTILTSYDKLQKIINVLPLLVVHFKQHEREGARKKHSIHLRLNFAGATIISNETGWDLVSTLQKALSYLERETIKALKK